MTGSTSMYDFDRRSAWVDLRVADPKAETTRSAAASSLDSWSGSRARETRHILVSGPGNCVLLVVPAAAQMGEPTFACQVERMSSDIDKEFLNMGEAHE
jgi:hypothetical protein